jgi:hypothetical protein
MLPERAADAPGELCMQAQRPRGREEPTMPENAKAMLADRVEVSWDTNKNKWLVRIQSGEEVIRRPCALPKGAGDQALRTAAEKAVQEEGYEPDLSRITIRR